MIEELILEVDAVSDLVLVLDGYGSEDVGVQVFQPLYSQPPPVHFPNYYLSF